jgi:hypothetical protein
MGVGAQVDGCPLGPGLQVDIVGEMTVGLTSGGGCVAGTICASADEVATAATTVAAISAVAARVPGSLGMAGPSCAVMRENQSPGWAEGWAAATAGGRV